MQTARNGIRNRSLTRPVIDLCGVTALIVAATFTLMLVSLEHLRSDQGWGRTASDLLTLSAATEQSIDNVGSGLRGYLLTRDGSFLAPYHQASTQLPEQLKRLSALSNGPAESREAARITSLAMSYMNGYAAPLVATGSRLSRAQIVTSTLRGQRLGVLLGAQFAVLGNLEVAQRARERAGVDTQSTLAVVVGAIGLGMSVLLLIGLAAYLVLRFIEPMRTVATAARTLASGRLDVRVPERGTGEVAALATSFNGMAETIESRDNELSQARDRLERAVEEAHAASAMKSNFVANMSHEIRTPLNGLVGTMDLLSETELTAEQKDYISVAKASGNALMMVVNDVLDIAKIESGRLELEHREFDLYDLVEGACDMVAATAATKGLELQSYVHSAVPPMAQGDGARVGQILANLLSNAVKFTAQGEVVLEVDVEAVSPSSARVCFEVRDTGIGLDQADADRLFEPFTQAEAGTTRTYGGTGLGLAIAYELTRMMGGTIDVDSELGAGTTFRVVIPFSVSEASPRPAGPGDELTGLHVLIVDDNATNRRIFEAYVASWGMRPVLAGSARSALAKLEWAVRHGDPFDIALLDNNMPRRSGTQLAREITAAPELRHTQLILLTSSGQATPVDPSTGIVYILAKPIRQSRMLEAITTVMSGQTEPIDPADAGAAEVINGDGKLILVAEDQPVNWMLIERLLTKRGHRAVNAIDGTQVLGKLEETRFDLVLMDCQMPVLDGYETTRQLRRREQRTGTRRIPIVAMTANAMQGDRERCLGVGMDDYLPKPITVAAVDTILARWLPRPDGAPPPVEPARIHELRTLFPGEEAAEIIGKLQADVGDGLARIAAALKAGDGAEASEVAHRIAGSAYMVGAAALAKAAGAVESAALRDLDEAGLAAEKLRDGWEIVDAVLEAERRSNGHDRRAGRDRRSVARQN